MNEIFHRTSIRNYLDRQMKSRTATPGSYGSSIYRKSAAMGILRRH